MKVHQKSNLQILFKNEEILREGGLTCVQKNVLAQIDKEQNTWLYNSVEREIKKINLRALKKRKQLSKKEYQLNKLFFNEWIRWWKPKKRTQNEKINPSKCHRMRINGTAKVLFQWVLYEVKEDYSYLIKYITEKLNHKMEKQKTITNKNI